MDIYTNPAKNTYLTGITRAFVMPTDSGGIPAVAVSKRASVYISSGYTILIILIFMIGWNLCLAIIMAFWPTRGDPNRRSALVALWNSGESMNAMSLMLSYCKRVILYLVGRKPKEASSDPEGNGVLSHLVVAGQSPTTDSNDIGLTDESEQIIQEKQSGTPEGHFHSNPECGVSNLLWGLLFVFIALTMTVGNVVAGILVPVQLSMGNVAPAAKEIIFYPDVAYYVLGDVNGAGLAKLASLKVPSALRALGAIEASDVTVRKRVHLDPRPDGGSGLLNYDYNVTGVDMGLQSDPKLKLMVKGSCRTDDTWLVKSTDGGDTYRLFGGNETFEVKPQPEVYLPPMVNFLIDKDTAGSSNVSYAMIVNTAGLNSYTPGQDQWYITDKTLNGSIAYQVRRGRPALSCWEAKTWHLNGNYVDGSRLATLPGLKLDKLWASQVFEFEFSVPRVVSMGTAAGASALKSASYAAAPSYILDAGASTIRDDLERLVLASWVSSRNVLRDTTTYNHGDMINLAKGPGGSVDAASAKFVLQSGDVVTLSLRILISVPAVLLFLFVMWGGLSWVLRHSDFGQKEIVPGEKRNAVALLATQLYRGLDQLRTSRDWEHKESLIPFAYPSKIKGTITKTGPDQKPRGTTTEQPADADDE